jgi:uncharacterized membrane protein
MLPLQLISRNKTYFILALFIAIIGIIILGCIFLPSLFYDQWIWKYYWGPIVADATPNTSTVIYNGVAAKEGYTIVSEITYGVLLVLALYGIYSLLKKLHITVNWVFCLSLIPYIIFGSVSRVLEDTGYFSEPWIYWFISPLIYVQTTLYALFFLLLGYYIEQRVKNKRITLAKIIFLGGLFILLPCIYLITQWILGDQWGESYGVRFDVLVIILSITSLIVGIVYILAKKYLKNSNLNVYSNPLNLSMIFGHLLDGITSYVSIYDPLNMALPSYIEKHPASDFLMQLWPPLFPIVKFILILFIIYVFDIVYKDDLKSHRNLVGLLKIGILILGFSPGLRDLLRVTLGV